MAGYVLHLTEQENMILSAAVVRRLIEGGNGDAALLYLAIVRSRGSSTSEKLREELRWGEEQLRRAESALHRMGLVALPGRESAPNGPLPPPDEPATPEYRREDVMQKLESDADFSRLLREVERKLGRLTDPSVKKLLGLYENLGLPADVVYLLVNHCIARRAEQFGTGRLPTMREIEKEGYAWARRELFSAEAANRYLRDEQEKRRRFPDYMAVLQLGGRAAAPSEARYLSAWAEMGFPPETVAVAYDKTVLHCHEFKWPYCNGILKKWHEKGLHTPDEVRAENAAPKPKSGGKNAWMREYD